MKPISAILAVLSVSSSFAFADTAIIRVLSDNADESASAAFASFVQDSKEPVTVPIAIMLIEQAPLGAGQAAAPRP